jgi:hypothetical protein
MTYLWLDEILADVVIDYEHFAVCERDIIGPALEEAGFRLRGGWYTGDGDSFGPLTRCIDTEQGTVVYG